MELKFVGIQNINLLAAADFAARKHKDQRRNDADTTPYINHPIAVAAMLSRVSDVSDLATLCAALLHDTVEDTATTPDELERMFGAEIRHLVMEVTDDKSLPQAERKRLQIESAPQLSHRARLIRIADKICNLSDLSGLNPTRWTLERKLAYLDWAENVVAGIRGTHLGLEQLFDATVAEKRRLFESLIPTTTH